jgi:hypothetical protein
MVSHPSVDGFTRISSRIDFAEVRAWGPLIEEDPMSDQKPVTEWIARVKAGDRNADTDLVQYVWNDVIEGCRKAIKRHGVRQSTRPSDLAQIVLARITGKLSAGKLASVTNRDDLAKLLSWSIKRKAIDTRRKQRAKKRSGEMVHGDDVLDSIQDNREVLHDIAVALQERWDQFVKQGDPREQDIFELLRLGYTLAEIRERLLPKYEEITPYTIRRAREKWRRFLADESSRHQ